VEVTQDILTEEDEKQKSFYELEERFRKLEFFEKTLNLVSSPFQEVCKENLREMEERLSTFPGVTNIN
jgi:hypothetical protein